MEKYIPDMYQKSIYTIDYNKLKANGIKCILIDLDNTLVPTSLDYPTKNNIELINELKEMGFKIILFSNSPKKRVKPFKDELQVDASASSMKPLKRKFLKVLNEYKYEQNEVAIIGDQILTDILGGNKVGITTILVNPVSSKDLLFTSLNRYLENRIINKLSKNNLFTKGKYYE
jgi:HAD superfamily phosphatase (TIGR01668 family)